MKSGFLDPLACEWVRPDKARLLGQFILSLVLSLSANVLHGQNYIWSTLAGNSGYGSANGPGTNASFYSPGSVAVDTSNNVFVADSANHLIRKITAAGVVTTLAGMAGISGSSNGVGTAAQFSYPTGVALDSSNNLFVADSGNHLIRRITPAGVVTTFAGTAGVAGSSNGVSMVAKFNTPTAIALDNSNNVYVTDSLNSTIRLITPAGLVSTLAGTPGKYGQTDGTGNAATFSYPQGITIDSSHNLYVADTYNHTIRQIAPGAVVSTLAGMAGQSGSLDSSGTNAQFAQPFGVAWDGSGGLFVADTENNIIRRVDLSSAKVTTFASGPGRSNPGDSDGTGSAAQFRGPQGIAVSSSGLAFIADTGNNLIRQMTTGGTVGTVSTVAGIPSLGTNDGPGAIARFNSPSGIAVDNSNNVFVADSGNNTIRLITPGGIVSTFAGVPGSIGRADSTNGPATFFRPAGLALDSSHNLFVADSLNNTIRKITPAGVVTTFAGLAPLSGTNDGTGNAARFHIPQGLAVDAADNLYVADELNNTIRMITPQGVVTTFAGTGVAGLSNGPVSVAQFSRPVAVAVDNFTNVYVMDYGNNAIRIITNDFWQVGSVAVGGLLYNVLGICLNPCVANSLLAANFSGRDNLIISTQNGLQTVFAGQQGTPGNTDGSSSVVTFNTPAAITTSRLAGPQGGCWTYVADSGNNNIRLGVPAPVAAISYPGNSAANFLYAGNTLCPISTFTGELYEPIVPDLSLGGPMPLVFQRYYAALIHSDGFIAGRLGENWLHNFEMNLAVLTNNVVQVVTRFGRVIQFTNFSGSFALMGRQDVPYQLAGNGTGYVLGDPWAKRLYSFNSSGLLTQIADGHGNAQTLSYSGNLLTNVSDGLGRFLNFQYNANSQLTNVSDGTRSIGFVQMGDLLSASTDALGNTTTYSYDTNNAISGLLTATTLPAGNQPFIQTFNTNGQVIMQVVAGAIPGTNTLNYASGVAGIADPVGNVTYQTNSSSGLLTALVDESGNVTTMTYNTNGQRASIADRLGHISLTSYHPPSGQVASVTLPDGTAVISTYTNRNVSGITFYDLARVAYPDGTTDNFVYDGLGNIISHTDRAGQSWTFTYDAHGQMLTATDPDDGVVTMTYNADGTLASRKDSDTGLTTFGYDGLRRLINVVHPDTSHLSVAYDADDRITTVTDELGHAYAYAYDIDGRLTEIVDPLGGSTKLIYDARNRLVQAIDPLGATNTVSYDARGFVSSSSTPTADVTLFAYDARRRLTMITDPGANQWTRGYDNEARVVTAANPLNQADTFQRNSLENVTNAIDALDNATGYTRDMLQRVTLVVDPLTRSNTFEYDPHDALTGAGRQEIGAAAYQRNGLGLLTRITDLNGNPWDFSYSPMGRPTALGDPLGRAAAYAYDGRGRLAKTTYADGTTRTNVLDPANNLVGLAYSSGPNLVFGYDSLNRLTSVENLAFAYDADSRLTNTVSSGVNFGAAYDASGRLVSVDYNNGAFRVSYSYDHRGLVTNVTDTLTGAKVSFVYDAAGRMTGVNRGNGVNGGRTYDAAGRLTGIQEGSFLNLQFSFDAAGEIVSNAITAPLDPTTLSVPGMLNLSYDSASQVAGSGYAFDQRGRQTRSPGHSFAWDGASRLTKVDGVTLGYDGLNQVVTHTQAGVTERYFYNHAIEMAPIVAERNDNTGQVVHYYVWTPGGQLLYLIDASQGNAVYYYHFDQAGSTLALTAGSGIVSDAYVYSPYGVALGHTGTSSQPFTFVGEFGVRSEPAANLYQMRARYYDPATTRFLTPDPVWPRLSQPDSLNPYQYALRNPGSRTDPLGLESSLASGVKPKLHWCEPFEDIMHFYDFFLWSQGLTSGPGAFHYAGEDAGVPAGSTTYSPGPDVRLCGSVDSVVDTTTMRMSVQKDNDFNPATYVPELRPILEDDYDRDLIDFPDAAAAQATDAQPGVSQLDFALPGLYAEDSGAGLGKAAGVSQACGASAGTCSTVVANTPFPFSQPVLSAGSFLLDCPEVETLQFIQFTWNHDSSYNFTQSIIRQKQSIPGLPVVHLSFPVGPPPP